MSAEMTAHSVYRLAIQSPSPSLLLTEYIEGDPMIEDSFITTLIRESLKDTRRSLKDTHCSIAPFPTWRSGLNERNQTHSFAQNILRRRSTLRCLHEMPFDNNGKREVLDTVVFDNDVVILIEAKCLGDVTKCFKSLQYDWDCKLPIAEMSFVSYVQPTVASSQRRVVRMILADYWGKHPDESMQEPALQYLKTMHTLGDNPPLPLKKYLDVSPWCGADRDPKRVCQHFDFDKILSLSAQEEQDAWMLKKWAGYTSHWLWAGWRIDGIAAKS